MGGRGVYARGHNTQVTMPEYLFRLEIDNVQKQFETYRAEHFGNASANGGTQEMCKKCACCLQYTLPAFTEYEQCPLCGWIDDPAQNLDIKSTSGRNPVSLQEARQKWAERQSRE